MHPIPASDGLLDGVRVLDLSIWRPGPYATQLLAEIGAEVTKVEPPGGDPMRVYPGLFASLHANKTSRVVDLKSADGQAEVLELARTTDVVVEGFRPGVVDRLGVGYAAVQEVNPAVIYCSISALGQTGPLAQTPAHDIGLQAWAGALSPDGGPPAHGHLPIADLSAGTFAAFAISAALVRRDRSGEGEYIDLAMADVLATWTGAVTPDAQGAPKDARGVPGYGTFAVADGYVALSIISEDHFWQALCALLELDDIAMVGFGERMHRMAELQLRVQEALETCIRDDLVSDLLAAGVPVAPVLDRTEMLALDHFRHRGVVTDDPWQSPAVGYPVRFTRHPARRDTPPPTVDP